MRRLAACLCLLFFALPSCRRPDTRPPDQVVRDLWSDDADDRDAARGTLLKRGKDAVPALLGALAGDDTVAALAAADTLAKIGKDAVPALALALSSAPNSPADRQRSWSIYALGLIGRDAAEAVPLIEEAQRDHALRDVAAEALKRIRG